MNKEEIIATLNGTSTNEEKADAIWKMFDGKFIPIHRFNDVNDERKTALSTIEERDKQLEELKGKAGKETELQTKITELIAENDQAKKDYEAKLEADKIAYEKQINADKLNNAVNIALVAAKAKDAKAVVPFLDYEKIKLDGNDLLGLKDQLETLQKEKDFLFESKQPAGFTGFQSGNSNTNGAAQQTKSLSQAIAEKLKK